MSSTKTKRIEARISPDDDSVIRAAAERRNVTLSEFLVESALVRAQIDMADRREVMLPPDAWDAFSAALDAPVAENERLAETFRRARSAKT